MPTNGCFIKPATVKLLAGEQISQPRIGLDKQVVGQGSLPRGFQRNLQSGCSLVSFCCVGNFKPETNRPQQPSKSQPRKENPHYSLDIYSPWGECQKHTLALSPKRVPKMLIDGFRAGLPVVSQKGCDSRTQPADVLVQLLEPYFSRWCVGQVSLADPTARLVFWTWMLNRYACLGPVDWEATAFWGPLLS